MTSEVLIISWALNTSAVPLHEALRIECFPALEIRFQFAPTYLLQRLHVGAGGKGWSAGANVPLEGWALNIGIRRSRGRRVVLCPVGTLVSLGLLRSMLRPAQVAAFRGRVYEVNHSVVLVPVAPAAPWAFCQPPGGPGSTDEERREKRAPTPPTPPLCPPPTPLDFGAHGVRRRSAPASPPATNARRTLRAGGREEEEGGGAGVLIATCDALFTASGLAQVPGAPALADELMCRCMFVHGLSVLRTHAPCAALLVGRHASSGRDAGADSGSPAPDNRYTRYPVNGYSERACTLLAESNFDAAFEDAKEFVGDDWGFPDVAVPEWRFRDAR